MKRILFYKVYVSVMCFFSVLSISCNSEKKISINKRANVRYLAQSIDIPNSENRVYRIQQQIATIYDRLLKSTVRINLDSKEAATAVMVSEDGYILTAAHVIQAIGGKEAQVRLYDGSEYTATCLGMDTAADYGLMKIESDKKLIHAKMGNATNLAKDETCLMFGHSNSTDKTRPAIGRIGFYKGINEGGFLKTSCIMMPGDSGGPLFDLNGNVVGICSYIGKALDENYYPSVENIKKNWNKLVKGEMLNNDRLHFNWDIIEAKEKENPFVLKGGKNTLIKVLSEKKQQVQKSVVTIESLLNDKKSIVEGVIYNSKGYIVAKSSQVAEEDLVCTLHNGVKINAEVIGRDKENDLIVLKVNTAKKINPIQFSKVNNSVGEILGTVSAIKSVVWSGMLGLGAHKVKTSDKGYLGVRFSHQSELEIGSVMPHSAADKAGLLSGDKVIKFNSKLLSNRYDLFNKLSITQPEEKINLTIVRNGANHNLEVVLGRKDSHQYGHKHHPTDYVEMHKRKDGFPNVFIHDMPLRINESGTPVINLKGEVIGLNIARLNRSSALAIPISKVKAVVDEILER